MRIKAYFDPHDLWVGVYWTRVRMAWLLPEELSQYGPVKFKMVTKVYLCLLPCLVIRLNFVGREVE